jgi:hypothetical protein
MSTRNVQTFLMVSAAFFAMNAPVRASSGTALAAAVAHTAQTAEAALDASEFQLVPAGQGGAARF